MAGPGSVRKGAHVLLFFLTRRNSQDVLGGGAFLPEETQAL
jgi:hypothetical protein